MCSAIPPRVKPRSRSGGHVETVLAETELGREAPARTRSFTEALARAATDDLPDVATVSLTTGVVRDFSDVKGYGFIVGDDGVEYFVHYSNVAGSGYRTLSSGDYVRCLATPAEPGHRRLMSTSSSAAPDVGTSLLTFSPPLTQGTEPSPLAMRSDLGRPSSPKVRVPPSQYWGSDEAGTTAETTDGGGDESHAAEYE